MLAFLLFLYIEYGRCVMLPSMLIGWLLRKMAKVISTQGGLIPQPLNDFFPYIHSKYQIHFCTLWNSGRGNGATKKIIGIDKRRICPVVSAYVLSSVLCLRVYNICNPLYAHGFLRWLLYDFQVLVTWPEIGPSQVLMEWYNKMTPSSRKCYLRETLHVQPPLITSPVYLSTPQPLGSHDSR